MLCFTVFLLPKCVFVFLSLFSLFSLFIWYFLSVYFPLIKYLDTPSQRVQFILGTEEDDEHVAHELFTELDEICVKEGKDTEWKETARYAWEKTQKHLD